MSATSVTDSALGLAFVDLACVPEVVAAKFPFLAPKPCSAFVPRVYFVALAVEIVKTPTKLDDTGKLVGGGTTAQMSVVIISYTKLLIGDMDTGRLTHSLSIAEDIMALISVEEDPLWAALIAANDAPGKDSLIQFPIESESTSFRATLERLHEHHVHDKLRTETVATLEEMREKVYFRVVSDTESGGRKPLDALTPSDVPQQLWSVLNLSAPTIADRMVYVKDMLGRVESESKESILHITQDSKQLDSIIQSAIEAEEEEIHALEAEMQKVCSEFDGIEREGVALTHLQEEVEERGHELERLRVMFAAEEDDWKQILQLKQEALLKESKKLMQQQTAQSAAVLEIEHEVEESAAELSRLQRSLAAFESPEYDALVQRRDAAVRALDAVRKEVLELQSDEVRDMRRHAENAAATAKKARASLEALLEETKRELEREAADKAALEGDVSGFQQEIAELTDAALIADSQMALAKAQLGSLIQEAEKMKQRNCELEREVSESAHAEDRPFYFVSKQRQREAADRRREVEKEILQHRKGRTQQRLDIQQELFRNTLRLDSLRKAHPFLRDMDDKGVLP